MFGPLGVPELIFIFALALLIFGPRKLPEIGRTIGKGLSEFRKASNDLKRTINAEMIEEEVRASDPRRILREDLDAGPKKKADAETSDSVTSVEAEPSGPAESTSSEVVEDGPSEDGAIDEATVSPSPAPGTVSRGSVSDAAEDTTSEDAVSEDAISKDPADETPIEPPSK